MTPSSAAPASGYLTTGQVAARIGATPQYVRGLIHAGTLDAINIGKGVRPSFRIPESAVAQFLQDRAVNPTGSEAA